MIRYISFDIGHVACVTDKDAVVAKAREQWPDFTYSDFKRMLVPQWRGMEKDYWKLFQNGLITAEEYVYASLRTGTLPDTEKNKEHFCAVLRTFTGTWYEPFLALARHLKQHGYHTSVLSNTNELLVQQDGLVAIVDAALFSHRIHVSKPDPKAYQILLERIGAKPEEVLFTDDREKNVSGAKNVGIHGYHFRSRELSMDEAFTEFVRHLKLVGLDVQESGTYFQQSL